MIKLLLAAVMPLLKSLLMKIVVDTVNTITLTVVKAVEQWAENQRKKDASFTVSGAEKKAIAIERVYAQVSRMPGADVVNNLHRLVDDAVEGAVHTMNANKLDFTTLESIPMETGERRMDLSSESSNVSD